METKIKNSFKRIEDYYGSRIAYISKGNGNNKYNYYCFMGLKSWGSCSRKDIFELKRGDKKIIKDYFKDLQNDYKLIGEAVKTL